MSGASGAPVTMLRFMNSMISKCAAAAAALTLAASVAACGGMSSQEKEMVGKYYIPAVSDTSPLLELNEDNQSVMRAIRPGELSFSVAGQWHVVGDSLVIVNDISSITIEDGDPGLVGTVAERVAYPIIAYEETTLRIKRQGAIYDYHRRGN